MAGVMAMLPADHIIPDAKQFQRVLSDCFDLAGRGQLMVTIGVQPTEPATGYGYIQVGEPLPTPPDARPYKTRFHLAERFVEKPPLAQALEYMNGGRHRWNAGMFIWGVTSIMEGLRQHQPAMHETCQRWFRVADRPGLLKRLLAKDYPGLARISIDYALMEHARNVVVADGAFGWDDVGSWNALARHLKPDAEGNCAVGEFLHIDAARNIIFDARTRSRAPVAAVGVTDMILVLTDDATLMAHKSQSQKIKNLVHKLAGDKRYRHLV
jgi:mannose-1-phosphate guanylyltransferase